MSRLLTTHDLEQIAVACGRLPEIRGNIVIVKGKHWKPHKDAGQCMEIIQEHRISIRFTNTGGAHISHGATEVHITISDATPARLKFAVCDVIRMVYAEKQRRKDL